MLRGARKIIGSGTVLFGVLLALFAAECFLNLELRNKDSAWVDTGEVDGRKWDPRLVRVLSFGNLPAVVDWIWLRVLMDPAIFHVPRGTHAKIYFDLDLVTDLDPAFFVAYRAGANILAVIRDDAIGARDLLVKARKFMDDELGKYPTAFRETHWPYPWAISLSLAYVYLFELDDLPRAAIEFKNAARSDNSPAYIRQLARKLETPGGEYEVGLHLLDVLARSDRDGRMAERLKEQRQSLLVARFLHDLNDRFGKFLRAGALEGALERNWERFLRSEGSSGRDPWGGALRLEENGRIGTSTPHEKVFGLS